MTHERRQAVTDAKLKVKEAVAILDEALELAQGAMLQEYEEVGDLDDLPLGFDILRATPRCVESLGARCVRFGAYGAPA